MRRGDPKMACKTLFFAFMYRCSSCYDRPDISFKPSIRSSESPFRDLAGQTGRERNAFPRNTDTEPSCLQAGIPDPGTSSSIHRQRRNPPKRTAAPKADNDHRAGLDGQSPHDRNPPLPRIERDPNGAVRGNSSGASGRVKTACGPARQQQPCLIEMSQRGDPKVFHRRRSPKKDSPGTVRMGVSTGTAAGPARSLDRIRSERHGSRNCSPLSGAYRKTREPAGSVRRKNSPRKEYRHRG